MISQSSKSALRNPWVLSFLLFITVVLAVNITFIWFTMQPGRSELVERDYKTKDRKANEQVLSELGTRKVLAWKTDIKPPREIVASTPLAYEISISDREGKPVSGTLSVQAYRASDASKDFVTDFKEVAAGRYQGYISFPLKGYWELHIRVQRGEDSFGVDTDRFMVAAAS